MKKIIFIILLLLIIPFKVNAASIYYANVTGPTNAKIGNEISEVFMITIDGVKQNDKNSPGVVAVVFELNFDDLVLTPTGINSNGWTSELIYDQSSKKYYVQSTIGFHPEYVCSDGILNCGKYKVTIEFMVNETNKETTTIKIGEIQVGLLNQIFDESEISEKDIKIITGKGTDSHTLIIKDNETTTPIKPKDSIVKNETKKNIKTQIKTNNVTNTTNIDKKNNHLKELKIEGYEIEFDKYKSIYEIEVPNTVNQLKITATPESSKAKVSITGADNLQESNGKVLIEVKPNEGDSKLYIINVTNLEEEIQKKENDFTITEDQIELGKKILIGIAIVIIVMFIIIRIRDRIVEKNIDKL